MDISLQNVDKVNSLLTIKIEKADYQAQVDKSLKTLRQKAQIPGFRKGMVPMSLIQKMYRKSVMAEEVNKLISDKLYGYIKEQNLNVLGEPLPNEEKQQEIDFDTMEDFEFVFDLGLAPEFEVEVSANDNIDYYTIEITEEMIDQQVDAYAQRAGGHQQVDSYQEKDMLKGHLAELDAEGNIKEGGVQVENAVLAPDYMKDAAQKALFAEVKPNTVIVFNPNTAFDGSEVEISSLLQVGREEVAGITGDFSFTINEITRYVNAEVNQALFDQVFGEGTVNSVEEFRAKIKESIETQTAPDSNYKLLLDARTLLTDKIGKLEYPDAILKRVMLLNNPDKGQEFIDENYDKSIEGLTWSLIKDKLIKAFEVKVEQDDVLDMAKGFARAQFAQYGMTSIPEEILENYAKEMLGKREQVEMIVDRAVDMKLAAILKDKMTLNNKVVSCEDFQKLFD